MADAISKLALLPRALVWNNEDRPSNVLTRLHLILSSFRGGGNKTLVDMLYRKMAEAQSRVGPTLPQPLLSTNSREHSDQSRLRHPRVIECHDEDDTSQSHAQVQYPHDTTVSTPIAPVFSDTPSETNRIPDLPRNQDNTGYPLTTVASGFQSQPEPHISNQHDRQPAQYQYSTLDGSTSATSPPAPFSPHTSGSDNNMPSIQQYIQQQQQQNAYDMNIDMISQMAYQPSPPPGSPSLTMQMQMMVEDLLHHQQSQSSQSQNQPAASFENILFPVGSIGGGNDDFRGSILGEEYPIVDG